MNQQRETHLAVETLINIPAERQVWTSRQRREWKERYRVDRHEHPALSFGERGLIQDSNKSLQILFGFRRSDLVWRQVSKLFPQLEGIELVQAGHINPLLNYFCRCGHFYQAQTRSGGILRSNLSIVRIEYAGRRSFRMIVRPE